MALTNAERQVAHRNKNAEQLTKLIEACKVLDNKWELAVKTEFNNTKAILELATAVGELRGEVWNTESRFGKQEFERRY